MLSSLTEIKGVGEKVRKALVEHFGSEETAINSFLNLEFYPLFSSPLPAHKALEIAREVYSQVEGFHYQDMLKTQEMREIYTEIFDILKSFASTEFGRFKLGLFFPTCSKTELEKRHRQVRKAIELIESTERDKIREIKKTLPKLLAEDENTSPETFSAVIVTEDKSLTQELIEKVKGQIEVFLLESSEDIRYLLEYKHIRYIQTENSRFLSQIESLDNVEVFFNPRDEDLIPEVVLSYYIKKRKAILAGKKIIESLGVDKLHRLKLDIDVSEFLSIAEKVELINGNERESVFNRFSLACKNFHEVIERVSNEINREIRAILEQDVALRGKDVLAILERGDVYKSLPNKILEILKEGAEKCERAIAKELGLEKESLMFSGLFDIRYPFQPNQEKQIEILRWLESKRAEKEFELKRKLAHELGDRQDIVRRSIEKLLEIDVLIALGEFSITYRGVIPSFGEELSFKGGRHIKLQELELAGNYKVQPVDYNIKKICVLTGANSGGKTTLLETIGQIQVMAQCGLPVLASSAVVPMIDEVYYFRKSIHGASAGALENLLKSFASLSTSSKKRLILADEIESVTEPGAAAKIISSILEWFLKDENTQIVLVTHLGEALKDIPNVRIDGIEAKGLDENLNLIVDRNPRIGRIAKSTPELILERLRKKEKSTDFYRYILGKFNKHNP